MPPHEPLIPENALLASQTDSIELIKADFIPEIIYKNTTSEYTREQLLSFAKCFTPDKVRSTCNKLLDQLTSLPSTIIRFGVLFPLRFITLGVSTVSFFIALPIGVSLNSKRIVSKSIQYYCKGILFSLGVKVNYVGKKPLLDKPHVFVGNHTSYLDYILLSAHQFPHAVVMARHTGALGFLQQNGLNYLNSLTFDRSNTTERKGLAESLKNHVHKSGTWKNPMLIFPEGTCVNNKYAIRFQKGAFDLGVTICPVGIKYNRHFGDPYWDTRKGFMYYAYYRMTRWISPVDVVYCDPIDRQKDETPVDFGNRTRDIIAKSIGLEKVEFNGMAKRDLLKVLKEEDLH